jgi:hypothetical protein
MKRLVTALALITLIWAVPHAVGQTAGTPSGLSYVQTIKRAATSTTLNSSSSVVGPTDPLTLTAVLSYPTSGQATGNVTFAVDNGSTPVGNYTAPVLNGVATLATLLPTGTLTITATYSGDANLLGSSSAAITLNVLGPADFDFSVSPLSVTQGQTGSATTPVTSLNGFHGSITFTCASPITTLGCGFLPTSLAVPTPVGQVNASAPAGSLAFSVTTIATTVERAGLIGAFFLSFMSFRQRRKYFVMLAVATLFVMMVGCGTSTRYLQEDGTPKGTYSVTVTGMSGSLSHTKTVLVTVR